MPENRLHPLCRTLQGVPGIVNDHDFVAGRRPRFVPYCQRKHRVSAYGAVGRPMDSGWNPHPSARKRLCKTSRVQEIDLLGDSKNSWTGYRRRNKPPSSLPCLQPPSSRTGDYYPIAPERERKMLAERGNPWLNEVRNRMILVKDFTHICGYQLEWSRMSELTGTSHDLCGLLRPGCCHLKIPSTTTCCSGPN